jgi:hypothetical protein
MELAKTSLQASRLFDVAANNTSPRYKECLFHMRAKRAGRNGPFFNYLSPEKIQEMAAKAYWEPYTHPKVPAGQQALMAPGWPGRLGVMRLEDVPAELIQLIAVRGVTNAVEAVFTGARGKEPKVDHTVALIGLGPHRTPMLYDIFPGDPVSPSQIKRYAECSRCRGYGAGCPRCGDLGVEDRDGLVASKDVLTQEGIEWVRLI